MPMPAAKQARRNLRLRAADDALIRRAAEATGQTVTEFLTSSALERAHETLADQRTCELDEATWTQFVKLLDERLRGD